MFHSSLRQIGREIEMKSEGILNPRRVMGICFISQDSEFVHNWSSFAAAYLRSNLKICTFSRERNKRNRGKQAEPGVTSGF